MKKGFSLVELIIVMLIAAIMAVVAITQAPSIKGVRLIQAADKVKSDIRYAQSFAISSQQRTRLAFDTAASSYTVYREQSAGNWVILADPLTRGNFTVDLNQNQFKGVTISSVNFVSANYHLVFSGAGLPFGYNPSGGLVTALSVSGTVVLSGDTIKTIAVTPVTGKVSLQ